MDEFDTSLARVKATVDSHMTEIATRLDVVNKVLALMGMTATVTIGPIRSPQGGAREPTR